MEERDLEAERDYRDVSGGSRYDRERRSREVYGSEKSGSARHRSGECINWMRSSLLFGGGSAFCLVFSLIYNVFSHGVHSPYMTYLCLWPLILGVLPALFFWRTAGWTRAAARPGAAGTSREILSGAAPKSFRCVVPGELSWQCYCEGVATLTMASLLRGILEIAGTASIYQQYLMIAGLILTAAGIAFCAAGMIKNLH